MVLIEYPVTPVNLVCQDMVNRGGTPHITPAQLSLAVQFSSYRLEPAATFDIKVENQAYYASFIRVQLQPRVG